MFLEPWCRGVLNDWKTSKNTVGCSLICTVYFERGPNVPNGFVCPANRLKHVIQPFRCLWNMGHYGEKMTNLSTTRPKLGYCGFYNILLYENR